MNLQLDSERNPEVKISVYDDTHTHTAAKTCSHQCKCVSLVHLKVFVIEKRRKLHSALQSPVFDTIIYFAQYRSHLEVFSHTHHFSKSSSISLAWVFTSPSTSRGSWWNSNLSSPISDTVYRTHPPDNSSVFVARAPPSRCQ